MNSLTNVLTPRYTREGIQLASTINYYDNTPCITLIEGNMFRYVCTCLAPFCENAAVARSSADHLFRGVLFEDILAMLNEESRMKTSSDENFKRKIDAFMPMAASNVADTEFVIRHYTENVTYNVTRFCAKNKAEGLEDHFRLLQTAKDEFILALFASKKTKAANAKRQNSVKKRDRVTPTVSSEFMASMTNLLQKVTPTRQHFVRCIKANENQVPWTFSKTCVLQQLRAVGVLETMKLISEGFPHRFPFEEFNGRFRSLAPRSHRHILRALDQNYAVPELALRSADVTEYDALWESNQTDERIDVRAAVRFLTNSGKSFLGGYLCTARFTCIE